METKKDISHAHKDVLNEKRALLQRYGEDRPAALFFCKKTEKLAAAIHLVTSFISEQEPIRQNLRRESINLLMDISTTGERQCEDTAFQELYARIRRILGLLSVASDAGYLSGMNNKVLQREYYNLERSLLERPDIFGHEPEVSQHFFDIHEKKQKIRLKSAIFQYGSETARQNDTKISDGLSQAKSGVRSVNRKSFKERHQARRERILSEIRSKKRVSVKDIAAVIAGCSEKTLQRELLSLVDEGAIKKEGRRRWSFYVLAQ